MLAIKMTAGSDSVLILSIILFMNLSRIRIHGSAFACVGVVVTFRGEIIQLRSIRRGLIVRHDISASRRFVIALHARCPCLGGSGKRKKAEKQSYS